MSVRSAVAVYPRRRLKQQTAGKVGATTAVASHQLRLAVLNRPLTVESFAHRRIVAVEFPDCPVCINSLGLDYLSRYAVTFDFPHHVIYLKPAGGYASLHPAGSLIESASSAMAKRSAFFRSARTVELPHSVCALEILLTTLNGTRASELPAADVVARLSGANRDLTLFFRTSIRW